MNINNIYAQNILQADSSEIIVEDSEMFTENINIISRSGKIFILTNSNQLLNKGDFITIALRENGPVARAVVAKTKDNQAGIKILKIYSLKRWGVLRKGIDVRIKRGDDSILFKPKKEVAEKSDDLKIDGEEDLFNDKNITDENLDSFYKDTRLIKPNNIATAGWNQYTFANDITEDIEAYNQWNFTWAYQFSDNYWVEGLYGRIQLDGFPSKASQTIINNFTVRAKYTFKAPLYAYFMPYIGFQTYSISSPNAGIAENESPAAINLATQETELINKLQTSQVVVGITLLKRLVPGWFLKGDLGTDIFSIGVGIEF